MIQQSNSSAVAERTAPIEAADTAQTAVQSEASDQDLFGKTILIIPEFAEFGGTREYLFNLLDFYASQGCRVVVALEPGQLDRELLARLRAVDFEWRPIRARHRGISNRMPFAFLYETRTAYALLRGERPDLVVCSVAVPGHWLGLMLLSTRLLYIVHTAPTQTSKSRAERLVTARLGNRRVILTVSDFGRRQIRRFWTGRRGSPVEVLYNPMGAEPDRAGVARPSEPPGVLQVLTLGHVRWYKNPLGWLEVAGNVLRQHEDIEVEFVWAGEGELLAECVRLAAAAGLDRVRFIGLQRDVGDLYATAQIYFQPSLAESHGIAVVDAMAWGLPCVVADTGGLPESVVDGETGFVVDPGDPIAMAEKISLLLADPALRARMGDAGRRRSLDLFSRELWSRGMIELHERLLQA